MPSTDPNATQDSAPDPIEDTQADESLDTAPDTQGSTVDWETRYKELQKRATKAERERDILREQVNQPSEDDEEDEPEPEPSPAPARQTAAPASSDRLARDSWALAEQIYGEPALDAYGRAAKLLDRAVTPADYVAAFEAYHEARSGGAKPAPTPQGDQGPAQQPRIDSNRPDESPDLTAIDQKAEAAKASGDLRGFLSAQLERVGIR